MATEDEKKRKRKRQLRLAQALQLQEQDLAGAAETELDEPSSFLDKGKAAFNYVDALAGEVNEGLMTLLPSIARNKLKEIGIGSEGEIEGPVAEGAQFVGMAAPFMAGIPAAANVAGRAVLSNPGIFRTLIDDIGKFAVEHPGLYFGGETAGAFSAGVAGELAEEEGAGRGGRLAAEVVGGLTGGTVATIGPRSFRALREGINANLLPFTEEGGMTRAARQMQERAGGPEAAARQAERVAETPEGVTPAQWIGDERLMAQEARLLEDNPQLANQVKGELEEARLIAQEALKDSFGQPRSRQQWEISVLERVTPEGTVITPGLSDEMLDEAYGSFKPLYDEAKGFDVPTVGLSQKIATAVYDDAYIVPRDTRSLVTRWFNKEASAIESQIEFDEVPSEALLELRSRVRDKRRALTKQQKTDESELVGAIETEITKHLEKNLPDETVATLRQADSQYRKYKVVENAIYNAADDAVSPQDLSQAIRMGGLSSQSQYARGANETTQELRRVALAGRSTEEVLGDPRRAELFIRDLSDIEQRAVQADFANVLFNRAKESSVSATEGGVSFISGRRLMQDLTEQEPVMKALGMSGDDIGRMRGMAETIQTMEKKSPAAVRELFEDGPATILQLVATLTGAKSGQRMAGQGLGSSLVLAQFMSNKARGTLANLTSDEAGRLMEDAATDPKLYKALLTKSVLGAKAMKENAQYLESWLLASAFDKAQQEDAP